MRCATRLASVEKLEGWQAVSYRKMRMARGDIESGAVGHLQLTPR